MPQVKILGTHHFGNSLWESFKRCVAFHNALWHQDYEELVVSSFAHKIKSEYYGGNISVSIEDISLEQFSDSDQETASSTSHTIKFNAVFHSFLSDNSN